MICAQSSLLLLFFYCFQYSTRPCYNRAKRLILLACPHVLNEKDVIKQKKELYKSITPFNQNQKRFKSLIYESLNYISRLRLKSLRSFLRF
jgi:hypothetical protein